MSTLCYNSIISPIYRGHPVGLCVMATAFFIIRQLVPDLAESSEAFPFHNVSVGRSSLLVFTYVDICRWFPFIRLHQYLTK